MPNYASVTLVGHLGKDPETKSLNSGDTVTSFSIATSRKRGDNETTTWWNCSLFGKRGEALARYLRKGDPVLVHGEPYQRKYQTSDGRDGVSLDVVCSDFAFIGAQDAQNARTGDSSDRGTSSHARTERTAQTGDRRVQDVPSAFDDDIPF